MPTRDFKYSSLEQLKGFLSTLENASVNGGTEALRNNNTGFWVGTKPLNEAERKQAKLAIRYEIYKRGCEGNDGAAKLEPKNPYQEKGMLVHSRSAVGVFGYPLPAPIVPPQP